MQSFSLILETPPLPAIITNDAIIFGILMGMLAFVFYTSHSDNKIFRKFYTVIPPFLMCYFLPSLLNWPLGSLWEDKVLIDPEHSNLYFMASRYLLPASLVLLCISIDLKGLLKLGPKALIMFFTATIGIVIGGPVALLIVGYISPGVVEAIGAGELWRGLSSIAGSWIGGGANQTAMREIFMPGSGYSELFSKMVVVDVVVANIWMGFLLFGAGISKRVDGWFKADSSAIDELIKKVEDYQASIVKNPTPTDYFMIIGVGFVATAIAHFGADTITPFFKEMNEESMKLMGPDGLPLYPKGKLVEWGLGALTTSFLWLVLIATTIGLALSFTKLRKLEGAGASKIGTVFIYILVATIGMEMNVGKALSNPGIFVIGLIWMFIHVSLLLTVGKLIRAPFFLTAVGSQANVGGAASAPVVATAFSPALAPVGVLMAVLGYALGTYGALICAWLMEFVSKWAFM